MLLSNISKMDSPKFYLLLAFGAILTGSLVFSQETIDIPTATNSYNLSYYFTPNSQIVLRIQAETTGYVGFGFTNVSGMVRSDMLIAGVNDNGSPYLGDYYSVTTTTPTRDAQQDWNLVLADQTATTTTVVVARNFVTNDENDVAIQAGVMNVIWAYGSSDALMYHGFSRSSLRFNILNGSDDGNAPEPPPTPQVLLA